MKLGHRLRPVLSLSLLCLLGCAARAAVRGKEPPPLPRTPPAASTEAEERDGLTVSGSLGQIDQDAVDEQFRGHLSEINGCYQEALRRQWFLSGHVELKLRVARDGTVRQAAVVQSSLGCYEVERCVLQVAQKLRFQPPQGGEAELLYPVEFPAQAPVRTWPEDRVAPQLSRRRAELGLCQARYQGRGHPRGSLRVTLYIGPGGRVASAGLSADEPIDERLAACLVARMRTFRFEDPLGQLVKATYALN